MMLVDVLCDVCPAKTVAKLIPTRNGYDTEFPAGWNVSMCPDCNRVKKENEKLNEEHRWEEHQREQERTKCKTCGAYDTSEFDQLEDTSTRECFTCHLFVCSKHCEGYTQDYCVDYCIECWEFVKEEDR